MPDSAPHHIKTPKKELSDFQKHVLRIYVFEGGYQTHRTIDICRQRNMELSPDTLRKWCRADKCQDYIERLQKESGTAVHGLRYATVQELALLGFSDITHIFGALAGKEANVKNLAKLSPHIRRTIKKIRIPFDKATNQSVIEIELFDKMAALKELSRISNASRVFQEADDVKSGGDFQLAGVNVIVSKLFNFEDEVRAIEYDDDLEF